MLQGSEVSFFRVEGLGFTIIGAGVFRVWGTQV